MIDIQRIRQHGLQQSSFIQQTNLFLGYLSTYPHMFLPKTSLLKQFCLGDTHLVFQRILCVENSGAIKRPDLLNICHGFCQHREYDVVRQFSKTQVPNALRRSERYFLGQSAESSDYLEFISEFHQVPEKWVLFLGTSRFWNKSLLSNGATKLPLTLLGLFCDNIHDIVTSNLNGQAKTALKDYLSVWNIDRWYTYKW